MHTYIHIQRSTYVHAYMHEFIHKNKTSPHYPIDDRQLIARILVKLPGIYVTLFACFPLPSLFVRYAHLTVMISLSRERELLWLRHEPLQSLALRFATNSFLLLDPLY